MTERTASRANLFFAVVSFLVAALPAFGVVLRSDPTGRVILSVVWILVGLAWLGQLLRVRRG